LTSLTPDSSHSTEIPIPEGPAIFSLPQSSEHTPSSITSATRHFDHIFSGNVYNHPTPSASSSYSCFVSSSSSHKSSMPSSTERSPSLWSRHLDQGGVVFETTTTASVLEETLWSKLNEILENYLLPNAKFAVNVSAENREQVFSAIEEYNSRDFSPFSLRGIMSSLSVTQLEIFHLMETDSYARFLKSTMYEQYRKLVLDRTSRPQQPRDSFGQSRFLRSLNMMLNREKRESQYQQQEERREEEIKIEKTGEEGGPSDPSGRPLESTEDSDQGKCSSSLEMVTVGAEG